MHTVPFHLTSPPYIFPALITRERKINQTVAVTTPPKTESRKVLLARRHQTWVWCVVTPN